MAEFTDDFHHSVVQRVVTDRFGRLELGKEVQDGIGQLAGTKCVAVSESLACPKQGPKDPLGVERLPVAVRANDPAWEAGGVGHGPLARSPSSVVFCGRVRTTRLAVFLHWRVRAKGRRLKGLMKSLHGQPPQAAELAKGLNGMAAEPDTDGVATSGLRTLAPAETAELLHRLRTNVASVLLGKPDLIQLSLVALLAEGHLLLEDVPGVGKTLLGKALP